MTDAIDIIHKDHMNLARVLKVLEDAVAPGAPDAPPKKPNFELLERILYYVRVFPDRCHHPKEEKFLFPALAGEGGEIGEVIAELQRQHVEGERMTAALVEQMHAAEAGFPDGLDELRDAIGAYAAFQRNHIALEESKILPRAREILADADWGAINRAFAADHDPLFGDNVETGFRALFNKITG